MIENYIKYLNFIESKLNNFFEKQKPYIFCKKGCGMCCKNAEFPFTQIEIVYLLSGIKDMDDETLEQIMANIKKIQQDKKNYTGEKFTYDCPFLLNNVCSVYEHRGIICRSFGLLTVYENGKSRAPFCCFKGYNYSNVMDDDGKTISAEKFKKLGVEQEPLAFNVSYNFLTDPDFEKGFNFKFGEVKPLIEWFNDVDTTEIK